MVSVMVIGSPSRSTPRSTLVPTGMVVISSRSSAYVVTGIVRPPAGVIEVRTSPFRIASSVWGDSAPSMVRTMRVAIPVSMSAATTAVFCEPVI